jgi:alpha-methylacyl-CoA racemase
VRVVEFAGIGPGPHAAMLLGDLGAEVLRIGRPGGGASPPVVGRGRHALELDLRREDGLAAALDACDAADVLIEGFRPGVMERLGLGPEALFARNARLVYGRMTGWGQEGPLAQAAGHDITYIALTGALAAITDGRGHPVPPLNLVGDFGGGSLYLAFGIVAALLERERSGRGQVVDAAIVDGAASLLAMFAGMGPSGPLSLDPERNMLGGAAPFYRCYACADGKFVAVGALEPQFFAELMARTGADAEALTPDRFDPSTWPARTEAMAALFATRTRDDWCAMLEGTDACVAPVLTYAEAAAHPHMAARGVYAEVAGAPQPAPAPRFSRTPGAVGPSGDGADLLARWRAGPPSRGA